MSAIANGILFLSMEPLQHLLENESTYEFLGTEINLVNRLARLNPDKEIHSLSPFQCLCSTMYRIKPKYLLWVLDNLANNEVKNQITVDPDTAELAKIALDRMLAI